MEETRKSKAQIIISTLLSGKQMNSREILEEIPTVSDRKFLIQDIANILSRLTNPERCDLAFFIQKKKKGNAFVYKLVDEILDFSEDKVYGLTLKKGENAYPLEKVIEEKPELKKYVKKVSSGKSSSKKTQKQKTGAGKKDSGAAEAFGFEEEVGSIDVTDILKDIIRMVSAETPIDINLNINIRFEGFSK